MKFLRTTAAASLLLLFAGCDNTPDELPVLEISSESVEEGVAEGKMTFTVSLLTTSDEEVTVEYRSIFGEATPGEDYESVSGVLSIPAGSTSATIEVPLIDDDVREEDEKFEVVIENAVNAQIIYKVGIGTILNDDFGFTFSGYESPLTYAGYTLAWQDEFEGTELSSDWTHEIGTGNNGWGNWELQYYREENASVEAGNLIITAKQESYNGSNYTSSRIITQGQQDFQYGRIDIRAVLPEGQGMWPALWMLGSNFSTIGWPKCGEIDIMEMVGGSGRENRVLGTAHWDNAGSNASYGGSYTKPSGTFAEEYHVFSIIWDENAIRWLVNDEQYHVIDITSAGLAEFREKFFFIFNIAVGGTLPGAPDGTAEFPQQMIVDYVRVFDKN